MQFNHKAEQGKQKSGIIAEEVALKYLQKRGLSLITRNYRTRLGEIDLILQHKTYIVFVEVRYRKMNLHAQAAMSVGFVKQQKIIKTAQYYLLHSKQFTQFPCRFDVVTISSNLNAPTIKWIPNAFELSNSF